MSAADPIDQDPTSAELLDLGPDDESALDLADEAADELPTPSGGRSAEKSAGAFRTISEVAEEIGIAQHVLRFWETKFTQIRPIKRAGGRRFYRPEDILVLREIRALLYDQGFTIKGAQKHLRSRRATVTAKRSLPPTTSLAAAPSAVPLPIPAVGAPEPRTGLDPRLRDRLAMLRDDLARLHTMLRESRQAPHATSQ